MANYRKALKLTKNLLAQFTQASRKMQDEIESGSANTRPQFEQIATIGVKLDRQQREINRELTQFTERLPEIVQRELQDFPLLEPAVPNEPANPPPTAPTATLE